MKKLIFLLSLLLCSCSFRSDYYTLSVDGYKFTVGYDNVEYLKTTFNLSIDENIEANNTIENVTVYTFDERFCNVDISNTSDKQITSDKGIITRLELYCGDVGNRNYALNDVELSDSVTSNCETFDGTLIKRNGVACVIESNKNGSLNVVELHGDILAKDQDVLDHIVIYVK